MSIEKFQSLPIILIYVFSSEYKQGLKAIIWCPQVRLTVIGLKIILLDNPTSYLTWNTDLPRSSSTDLGVSTTSRLVRLETSRFENTGSFRFPFSSWDRYQDNLFRASDLTLHHTDNTDKQNMCKSFSS